MKVIFLDVDGVLNCGDRWQSLPLADPRELSTRVCPEATARLKRLVEATGALIVVSSTWRMYFQGTLELWLDRNGIKRKVLGKTPTNGEIRGDEIQKWLDENHQVTEFVILDDDSDMGHLIDRLVKTTWKDGLQDEHVDRAIEMLGRV